MSADDRAALLAAHIAHVQEKPCVWGVDDCTRWAADWVERVRGIDLRLPRYAGEEQGRALIAQGGGLDALWRKRLASEGIFAADVPALGDVGLIEVRSGLIGVIVAQDGICALRTHEGVSFLRPRRFVEVWAI